METLNNPRRAHSFPLTKHHPLTPTPRPPPNPIDPPSASTSRATTLAPPTAPPSLATLTRPLRPLLYLTSTSLTFFLLFAAFIHVVLLREHVITGRVEWSATKTNYVVSVLSIISVFLTGGMLKALLGALRPVRAARERGSSWAAWTAQGSSSWVTVVQVAAANWFLEGWCLVRIVLPVLGLVVGSVVKCEFGFCLVDLVSSLLLSDCSFFPLLSSHHPLLSSPFHPSPLVGCDADTSTVKADFGFNFVTAVGTKAANLTVYAGLIPPDIDQLKFVTQADLAMFMNTWSASMLSNAMFALPYTKLAGCAPGKCRGVILPGAINLARRYGPALNESIYSVDTFAGTTAVRLMNVTGMVVRYDVPAAEDLVFDLARDCVYTGEQAENGLQMCFRQVGDSMLAGKSFFPPSPLVEHWH